jgi:pimeloyl-ACP methyl ester carboxylesterase
MIRQILSLVGIALLFNGCAQYSKVKKRPLSAVTVTAEQRAVAKSLKPLSGDYSARLGVLLDAANVARLKLAANPSDVLVRSDYNFAVARVMGIIGEEGLAPWVAPVSCRSETGKDWSLTLRRRHPRPEYNPSDFVIRPADIYDFRGKLVGERVIKQGLGAAIIVEGKEGKDFTKIDPFALSKRIYYGLTAVIRFNGSKCEIEVADPLAVETVQLDGHVYPLTGDFQSPLALALAELDPKKQEIAGLFKPDQFEDTARMGWLQLYHPDKIPVLCIHGLGNSPATWMPMIEFLRGDEQIRKHYQFWFFSYPSGLPYPMSAAMLRRQLDQFAKQHPEHKDIVVIGHSMGGMISRLLITDSGTKLWDALYDKPPAEMPFSEDTRRVMSDMLIFDARPEVSRVIYASASHRGSDDATNFAGRLGAKIIGNPISEDQINEEAIANLRPELGPNKRSHLPNSVDVLNPDSLFLKMIDTLPPKAGVPYHSIIGDRGKGGNLDHTKPVSTDGMVPYWSSHLDGAVSEKIIPSEHWSILHPQGMVEVERILKEHLTSQ